MKRAMFGLWLTLSIVPSAFALDPCGPEVEALQAFYDIRNLMLQPYSSSYEIQQRIDLHLDALREPLPGGGYRWVRYVRPSGNPPVDRKEHLVSANEAAGEVDTIDASAAHPFAVAIVVPRKRSLLKGNNAVHIGTLTIRYWIDGEQKTSTRAIDEWIRPDNSRNFDLGAIADRAEATLTASARESDLRESLVEIHFKQAVAQDDPANPAYDTIQRLKHFADYPSAATLDDEIARLESRLFGRPSSIPITVFFEKVREAEKLKGSKKEDEQEKGRKLLEEALGMMKK